jgi:hypothetical protein
MLQTRCGRMRQYGGNWEPADWAAGGVVGGDITGGVQAAGCLLQTRYGVDNICP